MKQSINQIVSGGSTKLLFPFFNVVKSANKTIHSVRLITKTDSVKYIASRCTNNCNILAYS